MTVHRARRWIFVVALASAAMGAGCDGSNFATGTTTMPLDPRNTAFVFTYRDRSVFALLAPIPYKLGNTANPNFDFDKLEYSLTVPLKDGEVTVVCEPERSGGLVRFAGAEFSLPDGQLFLLEDSGVRQVRLKRSLPDAKVREFLWRQGPVVDFLRR